MRIIDGTHIIEAVRNLFIELNYQPESLKNISFKEEGMSDDEAELAKILDENMLNAKDELRPLCQDCGIAQVFIKKGKFVSYSDAPELSILINKGVELAYSDGLLRKSTVRDPFERVNEGKNLPAFIHIEECEGDIFELWGLVKGGGSENVSALKMISPTEGRTGVANFVLETLRSAAGKGCPPYFIGLGTGGTFDSIPVTAKKALLEKCNEDEELYDMIMKRIRELDFGILGFPGISAVKELYIKKEPTHIAMMPVAVALNCHSFRSGKIIF
ncbi:MAG TPA: fumarate hydratase [bacterium]|jgi:fumarate hydratase subunit alpha|nr:fumarate hydratase [bacterium]MDX9805723.1 fumarate hydratase [bacterium]HNW15679.1 fumarate hydratase [bacterium]HNZ53442.1 fumarate hydratase [bacterium]HOG43556.1 fumarate hydratase [bacterium]